MHKTRNSQKAFAFASRCPDHVKAELRELSRKLEKRTKMREQAALAEMKNFKREM